ncbi:MAG: CoA pyrophosphatase [Ktedonobacteraceae bacterium]|nr:CoA pyrophosphatase [Ktedonobacteraceae bacterium]
MIHTVAALRALRERLTPVEEVSSLFDAVEGDHPEARQAAVLLPLFREEGTFYLAFIRRASTLRSHSGEMAFPGGKVEPTDLSPVMTALREAEEEIGLDSAGVEVLGLLPPVFTVVSNHVITPVVAFLPAGLGTLRLQETEVAELVVAPVHALLDPAIFHTEQFTRTGKTRTVHFYDYQSKYQVYRIWGATGRILTSLLTILQEP